jgi:hypothetical protein
MTTVTTIVAIIRIINKYKANIDSISVIIIFNGDNYYE